MFEIIETLDAGHFAGQIFAYITSSIFLIFIFELILGFTKIKKIK